MEDTDLSKKFVKILECMNYFYFLMQVNYLNLSTLTYIQVIRQASKNRNNLNIKKGTTSESIEKSEFYFQLAQNRRLVSKTKTVLEKH